MKRKIDSVNAEANTSSSVTSATTGASETVFNFEEKDLQTANIKNSKTNNNSNISGSGAKGNKHSSSLSVQIVQQISSHPQQDTSQTIHTNVTVSSHFGSDSPHSGNTSIHTSVQCKQEPSEENTRSSGTGSSSTIHNTLIDPSSVNDICIGIDDVDELQNILDSIEKDDDIEPSLLKDLNEFNEIYDKVQRDSKSSESASMYGPLACASPGLSKGAFPSYGSSAQLGSMFESNQNMSSATMTNHTIPVPASLPEPTGPAAETLKQMAAQHQHQHSPGYPLKGLDHFTDGLRNGGYSPDYPQLYRSVPNTNSAFPYNHMTNHHIGDSSHMTSDMAAAMGFGSTKPLTHFPNEQGQHHGSPSSLQQLQNQVHSHFKPASATPHQLQIMQTQHVQISHGSHNLQMSQTQQVQMQPSPQQISLSQQQTFNMGQQQMASEQMKMQMMEKMRMEQQQQAQQSHMPPQYMARPPPEYKMHHSARPQASYTGASIPNGNQNPLKTMQNMVNQTAAYGTVKSELASPPSSGQSSSGISSQLSAMQQQTMSASMASNGSHLPQSTQVRPGFHPQQHMSQPPAYSVVESSTCSQSSSSYASSTRNQRPPNVNVGPDGLNISQQRSHLDWQRASNLQPDHAGIRTGMPSSGPSYHGMVQSAPMSAHLLQYQQQHRPTHYGAGSNTGSMAATNMAQMQQQQLRQPIPSQMRGVPAAGLMASGSQMILQHQSMQVSQQMGMHGSGSGYMNVPSPGASALPAGGYNMGVSSPGSAGHGGASSNSQSNTSQSAGFPSQSASAQNQDEFLHFLDNPLSNQPMFDSSTADDFSLFDDILNGK